MTSYIIPGILVIILTLSMRKTQVYGAFCDGAANGLYTVFKIFPSILAILTSCAMLKASGAFDLFINFISPITHLFSIPDEIMPLAAIRPFSGGAAIGAFDDILKAYPPDSFICLVAAVMMGSSETTFYALSVYFEPTRVRYIKKIIPACVIGDIVGLIGAVLVCKIFF